MQDTKIRRCYRGEEGTLFTLFYLCHKVVLCLGQCGERPYFQRYRRLYFLF